MSSSPQNQVYENDESPEHHSSQAMCVNMPNDEPEGHYWSWVNAPQSAPNQYRECMSCGRIDATEWLASRDKQIALAARKQGYIDGVLSDKRSTDNVILHSTIQALEDVKMYGIDCTFGRNWESSHSEKAIPMKSIDSRIQHFESELRATLNQETENDHE